jgi:hypothetical protein
MTLGPAAWKLAGRATVGSRRRWWPDTSLIRRTVHRRELLILRGRPQIDRIGFPIAEMHRDGSFIITKHAGTGGLVSVGTITAQLLYEIQGQRYLNPDVTTRFDSIQLTQDGADRVRVSGIKGEPPPSTTKVCINYLGGYKNSMTFGLVGLDIRRARLAEETLWTLVGGRQLR